MKTITVPGLVFAAAALLPAQSQQEILFRQLSEKALNPKALAQQGEAAHGCRPEERSIVDPKYRESDYRGSGRSNFGSMAAETNPIPAALRPPHFFAAAERKGIGAYTVTTDTSRTFGLEEFKGKVVVLFLFKPECRWSNEMLPEIVRLQAQEEKAGIKVLPVSLGDGGWPAVVEFKSRNREAIPAAFQVFRPILDAGRTEKVLPELLAVPTTYILDRQGRIAWQILGGVRGALQDKVNHLRLEP